MDCALGLDVKTRYQDSALFLAAGDYHHHIGLNTWQSRGAPPLPADGYGMAEFVIESADAAAHRQRLASLNAANCALTPDGPATLVHDPSGNLIRLQVAAQQSGAGH